MKPAKIITTPNEGRNDTHNYSFFITIRVGIHKHYFELFTVILEVGVFCETALTAFKVVCRNGTEHCSILNRPNNGQL
jgi:hypothetical protein